MTLLKDYLRQRRALFGTCLGFGAIFAVTFALYRLPLMAVVYPVLLCALLGALVLFADYRRVKKKHRMLERLRHMTGAMMTEFPAPSAIAEQDYQQILRALQSELSALENTTAERYRNMMEYYTLWVHQIKTPIASMRLHLQNEDSPSSRRLQSDLLRIEQYVEMVLTFLRLDTDSHDYVFREHALDPIVRSAVRKFSHEFIDRRINLCYEPVEKTLVTDEKWLSFVLEQLLSNALKYTRTGTIRIYLRSPEVLCITDTGIGIAPEDLPRIFEKGFTGYNGRTDQKASGIGLYLCKRICDNLGISISASSVLGEGTTISLGLKQETHSQILTKM